VFLLLAFRGRCLGRALALLLLGVDGAEPPVVLDLDRALALAPGLGTRKRCWLQMLSHDSFLLSRVTGPATILFYLIAEVQFSTVSAPARTSDGVPP
jgi:hypothetical protein